MKQFFTIFVVCFLALSIFCGSVQAQDDCYTKAEVDSIIAQQLDSVLARYQLSATEFQMPDSVEFCDSVINLMDPLLRARFDREFLLFGGDQSQLMLYYKRGKQYFPVIESILISHGVPVDMKYCAVIESALLEMAGSNAGALGLWQIRKAAGREYDLVINEHIDQRYDLIASTNAAARYFRDLKNRFDDDWFIAMASYNWGQTNMKYAINEQETESYLQLQLPEETMRYGFRAAAVKWIMEYPLLVGLDPRRITYWPDPTPPDTAEVTVRYGLPAHYVVEWCSTTRAEIERLNPELIGDKWTPGPNGPVTYLIKIPPGAKEAFSLGLRALVARNKKQ